MPGPMSERADRFVDKLLTQMGKEGKEEEPKPEPPKSSLDLMRMLNRRRREARARRMGL